MPADDNGATLPDSSRVEDLANHIGLMDGDRTGGGDVGRWYPTTLQFCAQAVERRLRPSRRFLNPPRLSLFQLHTQAVFGFRVFGAAEFQKFWGNRGRSTWSKRTRIFGHRPII